MDNKPTGPYKHYQRPTSKRSDRDQETQATGSTSWIAVIVILLVILIALLPIVHRLAANNSQRVQQAPTTKKVASSSVSVKKFARSAKQKRNKQKLTADKASSSTKKLKAKTYLVKSGDSLTSIAAAHQMSVAKLAQLNGLDVDSNVQAGQTLKLK